MAERTRKTGRTMIPIELTPEQKEQVRQATGKAAAVPEMTPERLEERIAPGGAPGGVVMDR
jgi:hypothetical protein